MKNELEINGNTIKEYNKIRAEIKKYEHPIVRFHVRKKQLQRESFAIEMYFANYHVQSMAVSIEMIRYCTDIKFVARMAIEQLLIEWTLNALLYDGASL